MSSVSSIDNYNTYKIFLIDNSLPLRLEASLSCDSFFYHGRSKKKMSNQYLGYIVCLISAVIQWGKKKFKQATAIKRELKLRFFEPRSLLHLLYPQCKRLCLIRKMLRNLLCKFTVSNAKSSTRRNKFRLYFVHG